MDERALLEMADDLYGRPLPEFTAARDRRAKELKADGSDDLAAAVKRLRKPSTAAWVVDLLVRRDRDQVDQVLSVGAALREAQAAMEAGELRALTRQRRQVTAALATQARSRAAEEGLRVTAAVADQVEATLTAGMVDELCGRALRSGLLVAALATTGVDPMAEADVAAALALPEALGFSATPREAPEPGRPDLRVVPDPDAAQKAVSSAQERVTEAEADRAEATEALAELDAERSRLEARTLQLQAELEELRRRTGDVEAECEEVEEEAAIVEEERDEAAARVRRADADLATAQEALERASARS
ncbi:hypothetical protein [Nocardioides sambongensis]|uniref:hypothetical protein n=1 Tax=Nocardioides sambongensis TaxID=2589074 RepID=UPI001E554A51|nr:hypothetical protein [Nocardioides sambongensis]